MVDQTEVCEAYTARQALSGWRITPCVTPTFGIEAMSPTLSTMGMLRILRVALHVSFASLLTFGTVRSLRLDQPWAGLSVGISLILACVYLAGTVWENAYAQGRSTRNPRRLALPWLGVIFLLWASLIVITRDFSAVVFPLFFLFLHLLPRIAGLVSVAALTGCVVLSQWLHTGPNAFTPAMVFGPVLGMVFAVVAASSYRAMFAGVQAYRRIVADLQATRDELATTERAAGQAAERERLARDIHDTLAQGLSSIVLMSRAARDSLAEGATQLTASRLDTIETTAGENLSEARRFVKDLSSPALTVSLEDGLQRLARQASSQAHAQGHPLEVSFHHHGEGTAHPAQQTVVLRAVQSLLSNVARHANAQCAVVTLSWWPGEVSVDVVDNGVGFQADAATPPREPSTGGYGLTGLRQRVSDAGGHVVVESAPGEGTAVTVRVPTQAPPHQGFAAP